MQQSAVDMAVSQEPQKVFVYGTLKRGYRLNKHMSNAKYIAEAKLPGILFHLDAFPAMYHDNQLSCKVLGEVFEVPASEIASLDAIEGVPTLYERHRVYLAPHGPVWVYLFPKDRAEGLRFIIPTGRWIGEESTKLRWLGFDPVVKPGDPIPQGYKVVFNNETGRREIIHSITGKVLNIDSIIATPSRAVVPLGVMGAPSPAPITRITAPVIKEIQVGPGYEDA